MNSFPSASQMCDPFPLAINKGVPPTERNARTGELTPPGKYSFAFEKSCSERFVFMATDFAD